MVRYADLAFYMTEYGGNIIPNEQFQRVITRASTDIEAITFSRVDENNIPEEVKAAACAVAEVIYKAESSTEGEKKSENTDGYSVTYVTEQTDGEIKEVILRKKQYAAAYPHLVLTGLLSRGCSG